AARRACSVAGWLVLTIRGAGSWSSRSSPPGSGWRTTPTADLDVRACSALLIVAVGGGSALVSWAPVSEARLMTMRIGTTARSRVRPPGADRCLTDIGDLRSGAG